LRSGDVLLSIRGTFGRVCLVPEELDGANITQDTARLSIDSRIDSAYAMLFLRSPGSQDRLRRCAKGVAVRGVNIGDVRALQIALPPLEEQREVARRVAELMRAADNVQQAVTRARLHADRMTQAILAKGLAGELVPTEATLAGRDGREFEPASVLLERIKKERDSAMSIRARKRTVTATRK
jgi:type I restriction enzyme S subunit